MDFCHCYFSSILVFKDCYNKAPEAECLTTTKVYHLCSGSYRSGIKVSAELVSSEGSKGKPTPCLF